MCFVSQMKSHILNFFLQINLIKYQVENEIHKNIVATFPGKQNVSSFGYFVDLKTKTSKIYKI